MQYRELGSTGIMVSEIGFGAWGIGGDSYGPVDDNVAKKTLETAFDNGVNFFDTSDLYGKGHSEELIGDTFLNKRDKIIIATKFGALPHEGLIMKHDFSLKHIEESINKSLTRLKTDYIDIYQFHSPNLKKINMLDVLGFLKFCKLKGKIRNFGISIKSPLDSEEAIVKYKLPIIQVNFNLLDQRLKKNGLFELAKKNNTGIIIRTPLVFGYLTGKLTGDDKFSKNDHRLNWSRKQNKKWATSLSLFKFIYKKYKPSQAALRYCLDFKQVSTVIPGMTSPDQVIENVVTSNLPAFTKEDHELIEYIYDTNNFFYKN